MYRIIRDIKPLFLFCKQISWFYDCFNLARPEKIKTKLGQRLRDVRFYFGDPDRISFASKLGIGRESLAGYERGDSVPNAEVIRQYVETLNVNAQWLITGEGEMFNNAASAPSSLRTVDTVILIKIAGKVEDVYKGLGQRPTKAHITGVAADIYNDMLNTGTDFNDDDELTATIALEMVKLKKRILNGDINPGKAAALN